MMPENTKIEGVIFCHVQKFIGVTFCIRVGNPREPFGNVPCADLFNKSMFVTMCWLAQNEALCGDNGHDSAEFNSVVSFYINRHVDLHYYI